MTYTRMGFFILVAAAETFIMWLSTYTSTLDLSPIMVVLDLIVFLFCATMAVTLAWEAYTDTN